MAVTCGGVDCYSSYQFNSCRRTIAYRHPGSYNTTKNLPSYPSEAPLSTSSSLSPSHSLPTIPSMFHPHSPYNTAAHLHNNPPSN